MWGVGQAGLGLDKLIIFVNYVHFAVNVHYCRELLLEMGRKSFVEAQR